MSKREYKSSVFSMLLEEPEYALDVYNALNGTDYCDAGMIKVQRIDGGVLLSVRNDASFLIDSYFNVYEHQSTYNPNMPLRFMIYFSGLMWDFIKLHDYDLYSTRKIPVPTPRFVVFYNGLNERPAKEVFHLSDLYEHQCDEYDLDLTCVAYNINPGYNKELEKDSKVLHGYMTFVQKVRTYDEEKDDLEESINHAIDECISEGILVDFFERRRFEVVENALLDMTFEKREKLIARDNRELGREEGLEIGREEGLEIGLRTLINTLKNISEDFDYVYNMVVRNKEYASCTKEEIRKYF